MSEGPLPFRAFRYERPDVAAHKKVVKLARTDRMFAAVQVVAKGGENNLHSHPNMDGLWMVLKGRVRFYGDGDEVLGEYGPMEGVLIPRGFKYWFESASDEVLEILQFEAFAKSLAENTGAASGERINHSPVRATLDPEKVEIIDATVS